MKFLLFVLFILALNLVLGMLYRKFIRKKYKNIYDELYKIRLSNELVYKEHLVEENLNMHRTMHDLKNIMFSIYGSISVGKADEAIDKIMKICNELPIKENASITGNACIDTLLVAKSLISKSKGIKFEIINKFNSNISSNDIDLCIILGNALDNAIEACEKIENSNNRYIKVILKGENNSVSVCIHNSKVNDIEIFGDSILTTKKDERKHGLGIKSIKSIVNKHDGVIKFSQNKNDFKLNLVLNNLDEDKKACV